MLTALYPNAQIQYEQVQSTNFARVKHCSQTSATFDSEHPNGHQTFMEWRFDNSNIGANDPTAFKYPFENETYLRLSREQEDWWHGLCEESARFGMPDGQSSMTPAQIESMWRNTVNPKKAFTNNRDLNVWGYRINGTQLRLEPVICTGATVKLIGGEFDWNGRKWRKFEVIDMAGDEWRNMTIATHWHLIQPATSSWNTVKGEQINPFPLTAGSRMTPYFLWGIGTKEAYLPSAWFEPLPDDLVKPAYPYWKTWAVADAARWDERTMQ